MSTYFLERHGKLLKVKYKYHFCPGDNDTPENEFFKIYSMEMELITDNGTQWVDVMEVLQLFYDDYEIISETILENILETK